MSTTGDANSQSRNAETSKKRALGEFFVTKASQHDMWQFFNPLERNWEFLRVRKLSGQSSHSVIFRNGWVVRALQKGRPPFYYAVDQNDLKSLRPGAASSLAYEYSTGNRVLEVFREPEGLLIDLNTVFLPQPHYSDLLKLGEHRNILGENSMVFPPENLDKVVQVLKPLGITVGPPIESSQTDYSKADAVSPKISTLLTLLYSKYLKKESEIEYLQVALLTRDFARVIYPEVKSSLEEIYEVSQENKENRIIGSFLSDKVVSFFDWKDLHGLGVNATIEGTVLQTTPKEYIGKWSTNYFKIIVPELESVLHLQTTIAPTKHGTGKIHPLAVRLNKIALEKWRIYSYLGKLKNTGTNEQVSFVESEKAFIDSSFSTILGIPSIEMILRKMCYLDSFKLDLEEWKGAYDLTRYFIAYVRIKETMAMSAKTPCTVVEDFFGNSFVLAWDYRTYEHYKSEIHAIQPGGYISILLENQLNNAWNEAEGIDFETVFGLSFRFVDREEFILRNNLAIVKYLGSIHVNELRGMVKSLYSHTPFSAVVKRLEDRGLVVVRNEIVHYLYRSLTREQLVTLLEAAEQPDKQLDDSVLSQRWYVMWSLMRESISSVHPLIYSESIYEPESIEMMKTEKYSRIIDFCRKTKDFQQARTNERSQARTNYVFNLRRDERMKYFDTLVGDKPEEVYVNHSSLMLKMFSQASVKARGKWIAKAHNVVKYITRRFSYMEPSVRRMDRVVTSPDGKKVKEAEFVVEIFKLG